MNALIYILLYACVKRPYAGFPILDNVCILHIHVFLRQHSWGNIFIIIIFNISQECLNVISSTVDMYEINVLFRNRKSYFYL